MCRASAKQEDKDTKNLQEVRFQENNNEQECEGGGEQGPKMNKAYTK
jgi:hypothetical protein